MMELLGDVNSLVVVTHYMSVTERQTVTSSLPRFAIVVG